MGKRGGGRGCQSLIDPKGQDLTIHEMVDGAGNTLRSNTTGREWRTLNSEKWME